ncbi:MAG TPA: hypothetical protein EYQ31_04895 [Candidatus Handelsmanbacteria bacterium]|nr:hypothetical protein [Candidatus Handelsmanbacteria bacterium]
MRAEAEGSIPFLATAVAEGVGSRADRCRGLCRRPACISLRGDISLDACVDAGVDAGAGILSTR